MPIKQRSSNDQANKGKSGARVMTVKELKEALEMYDDNAQVLFSAPDDLYGVRVVEQDSDREYYVYLEGE